MKGEFLHERRTISMNKPTSIEKGIKFKMMQIEQFEKYYELLS